MHRPGLNCARPPPREGGELSGVVPRPVESGGPTDDHASKPEAEGEETVASEARRTDVRPRSASSGFPHLGPETTAAVNRVASSSDGENSQMAWHCVPSNLSKTDPPWLTRGVPKGGGVRRTTPRIYVTVKAGSSATE